MARLDRFTTVFVGDLTNYLFNHFLKERVRRGSVRAVKSYIRTVQFVRTGLMASFVVGAISAVFVAGLVMIASGLIGLLPIEATSMALVLIAVGFSMSSIVAVVLILTFRQQLWLERSKSYELMEAALAPWPGAWPPNPREVMFGDGKAVVVKSRSNEHSQALV